MEFEFKEDDQWYWFRLGDYSISLSKNKEWSAEEIADYLETLTNFYTKTQFRYNTLLKEYGEVVDGL